MVRPFGDRDHLVVGVPTDGTAAAYQRRPIMTLAEHDIAVVVHGDDLSPEGAEAVYGPALAAGRLAYVPRTTGISTTDLIRRVLAAKTAGALD